MEYEVRKLGDIKPYENNPRIIDDAVDDVVESIKQCSYIAPIVIDEDGVILAGYSAINYTMIFKINQRSQRSHRLPH